MSQNFGGKPLSSVCEWIGLCGALILMCGALVYSEALFRADLYFFDMSSPLFAGISAHKIAVVAVDDKTIRALGGWPPRLSVHAALVDRLTRSGVSAVGLDFNMAQESESGSLDDGELAAAMRRNGKVITRSVTSRIDGSASVLLPTEVIADASFASGSADFSSDRDGVVRGFHLAEGNSGGMYERMAYFLLCASGTFPKQCADPTRFRTYSTQASCPCYVPLGRHRSYESFSYIDVLRGDVPASSLRGRIAIIGVTANGMGAKLATQLVDGQSLDGVEFLAEETNALANGSLVQPASRACQFIFNILVLPFLCAGLFLFGPRASLIASVSLSGITLLLATAVLCVQHMFLFPSAAVATCLVAYPLWSWRRQEALMNYLSAEVERVKKEPSLPDESHASLTIRDPVQRRLTAMSDMVARVRRYREFVSEWVEGLPEATLLASSSGVVLLANERVTALVATGAHAAGKFSDHTGRQAADVLFDMTSSHRVAAFVAHALESFFRGPADEMTSFFGETALAQGIEIVDARARSLLIKCAVIGPTGGRNGALIFHVADLTSIRKTERQRDITLRFLSHDIRSPQAAMLALVEQMRQSPPSLSEGRFTELVSHYATSALNLADDFLFLARAESHPPSALVNLDLALLLGDAVDDLWPQAHAKNATVQLVAEPGCIVSADISLLRRAFANLIDNAIKFSPLNAVVVVELGEQGASWKVSIIDNGIGISEREGHQLFREFERLDLNTSRSGGHGLGLAFVKTVIDMLGGQVSVKSKPNSGSAFSVLLPKVFGA
jgi:signal transduction histidine kinase/CHASE2 domain-containing sensor protein